MGSIGLASLAASGIISLTALGDRARLSTLLDPTGSRPSTAEAAQLTASLNAKSVLVTSTLVGGAALFVSGAVCTYVGIQSAAVHPTVIAGPGIGGMALGGKF